MRIDVIGEPYPQGSVQMYAARRKGGEYTGKLGTRPDSPGLPAWRNAVAEAGLRTMNRLNEEPMVGPLIFAATIRMSRPADHYRTSGGRRLDELKDSAPVWPVDGRAAKDIDKLMRAIFDGLVAGKVIADDSLFVQVGPVQRVYAEPGEQPGADIWIARALAKPSRWHLSSPQPDTAINGG